MGHGEGGGPVLLVPTELRCALERADAAHETAKRVFGWLPARAPQTDAAAWLAPRLDRFAAAREAAVARFRSGGATAREAGAALDAATEAFLAEAFAYARGREGSS